MVCCKIQADQDDWILWREFGRIGNEINKYAFQNLDTLKQIVTKVVMFEQTNDEHYDQRWINLSGMDAMISGLADKKQNKKLKKRLH